MHTKADKINTSTQNNKFKI